VITALVLDRGVVPPTINLDCPVPEADGIDLVPHTAREARVQIAVNNSFGFGGTNGTIVLRKV
jgi:3-oxoacyl-[acyl-carrier-protein] synthase II